MSGWEESTLGELLETIRNGVNCKQNKDGIGDKISRIESIAKGVFDYARVGFSKLNEKEKGKSRLEEGDILFSHINSVPHVGKTALFTGKETVYHGVNLLLMRPTTAILPDFLEKYLSWIHGFGFWRTICKQSINQASVNQQDIKKVSVSFPVSLSEQKRIVAILDEAFGAIAKAKENAERNLANAKELFESYLNKVFTEKGEGWEETTVGESCVFSQGIQVAVKEQSDTKDRDQHVRFLRIVDFTQGNESPRYISMPDAKFLVETSDVSLVRYGASTGFVCTGLSGAIANNLFRVIPRLDSLQSPFLFWHLCSDSFQGEIRKRMRGVAMPAISFGMIGELPIAIPVQKEQSKMVAKLTELQERVANSRAIYQQKLADLDELKQSILQKAFTGQLTAKSPELEAVG